MCDSQSVVYMVKNPSHHEKTKHIDVGYHFIREILEKKEKTLIKVAGEENVANMFTKVVLMSKLQHYLSILNVFCI